MEAAARPRRTARAPASTLAEKIKDAAASAAKAMLTMETPLGRRPRRSSAALAAWAQRDWRA